MTVDEILAELDGILHDPGPEDAYTTPEWAERFGLASAATRKRLKLLQKAGRLDVVRVQREGLDGALYSVTAYRILPG